MPPQTRSSTIRKTVANANTSPQSALSSAGQSHSTAKKRPVGGTRAAKNKTAVKVASDRPECIPRFVIDLSLPPEQRYLEVCAAYQHEMSDLTSLFDDVVGEGVKFLPLAITKFFCRLLLRGVYNREESAELRGISKATGVSMYLLVAFNVLLDLFMGCSSGGVAIRDGEYGDETKMVHFRTLDWGMPSLRRVIVQLDYKFRPHGEIVATSITYAGFVGVLTGVRRNLSISLNFRGVHNDMDKWTANVQYYWHLLMVLVGFRPSISSVLRNFLLCRTPNTKKRPSRTSRHEDELKLYDFSQVISQLTTSHHESSPTPPQTTACYLCVSNGDKTTIIQRDRTSARTRSNEDFVVVTNGDFKGKYSHHSPVDKGEKSKTATALDEILEESVDRQQCAEKNWSKMKARNARKARNAGLRSTSSSMDMNDVVEMVQKFPTTNEVTHFACVMDPREGSVNWSRMWREPVSDKWIRAHMGERA